jgi:glycosyltransferase involved in cell wall biosynthesis
MLKIAMVAEHAHLQERDAVLRTPHLMALAEGLVNAGHEVTVYARRLDDRAPDEADSLRGFRVVRLQGRLRPALSDALRATRPDVVHVHSGSVWQAAAAACRELDVPFVYSVHAAADTYVAVRTHDTEADLAAAHAADGVIAGFSAQVRKLVGDGVPRQNIAVVPYGVDVDHFNPDGMPAERRLPNRIVAVGDLVPSSGFGTPIAALPALADTELVLVGGPQRGAHAREIRDYARSLGVSDRVLVAGPVPRAELPALLRSADLMVCSPWEPMFGVPALEAMACGVAVVANRLGGLTDTVVDNITGTHVTPRKPRELAATLLRLLHHKSLCEQQGGAGRDRAWARYSWAHIATQTVHAYVRAGVTDPAVLARQAEAVRQMARRAGVGVVT